MTDKELSARAVELFPKLFPDAFKCIKASRHQVSGLSRCENHCCRQKCIDIPEICPSPDPIDINDWDIAMKLVRAVSKDYGILWLFVVYESKNNYPEHQEWVVSVSECKNLDELDIDYDGQVAFWEWTLREATPRDYIEAACLAKEKENGQ